MKSAQNRSIQSMAKIKWETEWKTGRENARRLRNMSQYPGTTTGPKLYELLIAIDFKFIYIWGRGESWGTI